MSPSTKKNLKTCLIWLYNLNYTFECKHMIQIYYYYFFKDLETELDLFLFSLSRREERKSPTFIILLCSIISLFIYALVNNIHNNMQAWCCIFTKLWVIIKQISTSTTSGFYLRWGKRVKFWCQEDGPKINSCWRVVRTLITYIFWTQKRTQSSYNLQNFPRKDSYISKFILFQNYDKNVTRCFTIL